MNIESLNYDDYIDEPSIPYQSERDYEYRRPNDIMSPCTFYMCERALFVGDKFEDELTIISNGGEFGVGALGNFERPFVDAADIPNDRLCHGQWEAERQDQFLSGFFQNGFFSRMHVDFQFPLIWYLECHYDYLKLNKLIFGDPLQKGVGLLDSLFSDELKVIWEPHKLWLLNNVPSVVN